MISIILLVIGVIGMIAGYLMTQNDNIKGVFVFFGSFILILISGLGCVIHGIHYTTGNGTHLGYISSTETSGIIYKTPRAYFKTSLRSSQEDKYCIENMSLYKKLSNLQNENILITYKSYLVNGVKICAGESAIITGFKVISR